MTPTQLSVRLRPSLQEGPGGPSDAYDCIAVESFDSLDDMASKDAQPEALAAAEDRAEDEGQFIGHSASRIWFTEHHTIL